MKRGFTILAVVTAVLLCCGLYAALIAAPTEQTMGNVQRIFYYHVSSAWTAFLLFTINFVASIAYLLRRNTTTDIVALISAEVGVVFCTVVLVTGPLWARPVWGIWWTWDPRLTLTFALWLIYVSYLLLRRFSTSSQAAVLAAVLAVFGGLDVPLDYLAIRWWRGQHPAPVIGGGGSLDAHMWYVLLINVAAFVCLAWLLCIVRYRLEVLKREVEETQALESLMEAGR